MQNTRSIGTPGFSGKLVFVLGGFYLKYLLKIEQGTKQTKNNAALKRRISSPPWGWRGS